MGSSGAARASWTTVLVVCDVLLASSARLEALMVQRARMTGFAAAVEICSLLETWRVESAQLLDPLMEELAMPTAALHFSLLSQSVYKEPIRPGIPTPSRVAKRAVGLRIDLCKGRPYVVNDRAMVFSWI